MMARDKRFKDWQEELKEIIGDPTERVFNLTTILIDSKQKEAKFSRLREFAEDLRGEGHFWTTPENIGKEILKILEDK